MPRLNPIFTNLRAYPIAELNRLKKEVVDSGIRLFDFGTGDPQEPTAQFIQDALKSSLKPRCGYPGVAGSALVRNAIARYLKRRFGVTVDPETQILPTAGSKEAVFHTPMMVIDPNAEDRLVVFPDPGYPAYQRGALFAGGEPCPVALEGDHVFRPWKLPSDVLRRTRMMWINSPHNPSGVITSLSDLQRTADLCREYDILCIADETYADVYVEERPHSLLECGVEGMLVLHSLSKRSGMTGYRSGFLAGDPELMGLLRTFRSNPGLVPQDFVNAAAAAAWSDDEHVAQRRAIFNEKRDLFLAFFNEMGIEVVGSAATIYLWIRVPDGHTEETWSSMLLQSGIVVSPGPMFGVSGAGVGFVRLALVPPMSVCREAIALWRTLL